MSKPHAVAPANYSTLASLYYYWLSTS